MLKYGFECMYSEKACMNELWVIDNIMNNRLEMVRWCFDDIEQHMLNFEDNYQVLQCALWQIYSAESDLQNFENYVRDKQWNIDNVGNLKITDDRSLRVRWIAKHIYTVRQKYYKTEKSLNRLKKAVNFFKRG